MINIFRDNLKASSLSSKAAFPAVVAVPMHQGSYPNVVALPVHQGTGSLLPSTILNELSGGTAEISGGSADQNKQNKDNEEKILGKINCILNPYIQKYIINQH
jgi:hypothetical protein